MGKCLESMAVIPVLVFGVFLGGELSYIKCHVVGTLSWFIIYLFGERFFIECTAITVPKLKGSRCDCLLVVEEQICIRQFLDIKVQISMVLTFSLHMLFLVWDIIDFSIEKFGIFVSGLYWKTQAS
jgi:hypothetical protein